MTITSVYDDLFGDLEAMPGSSLTLPQTILPGNSYSFTFGVDMMGNEGDTHTNVATATGHDDEGEPVSDSDDETVTVTGAAPSIEVTKTADVSSVTEPGGYVVYTVEVTNNSVATDPVTITSVYDDLFGDLEAMPGSSLTLPQTILPGNSYSFTFGVDMMGNEGDTHTNVATATGHDDEGEPVSDSDDETVTVTGAAPSIEVTKTADVSSVTEPGGYVVYTVEVTNNSVATDPVTITSVYDDLFGDLEAMPGSSLTLPQTILPGNSYSFTFGVDMMGNEGDTHTNVATATGHDDEGEPVSDSDDETVTVTGAAPSIEVTKTADQSEVFAPGEDVIFTIVIKNNSVATDPVTIDSVYDDYYGELGFLLNPSLPIILLPGDSYTGTFSEYISADETNTVTVVATDDDGTQTNGYDSTSVDAINPSLDIEKLTEGNDADLAPVLKSL